MDISQEQWTAARTAFARAADRFDRLLGAVPDPRTRATKEWSIARTAAHMASLTRVYTTIVESGQHPCRDALRPRLEATTVETVRDFNELLLRRCVVERELAELATRLRHDMDALLRATEDRDPAEAVHWLGGSRLPLAGLLAHLTNEMLIHGWDIARAIRQPWSIPPRDAALFIELFLVGVTSYGYGVLLDGTATPPPRSIAVQFRSRYIAPVTMVLDGRVGGPGNRDRVFVREPGPTDDVRLTFDPAVLNLMLFGRMSNARAARTGKVRVAGPRPWLLATFLRTVHMPDN